MQIVFQIQIRIFLHINGQPMKSPKQFPENFGELDNGMQPFRKQHFKDSHINSPFICPDMPEIYPTHIA